MRETALRSWTQKCLLLVCGQTVGRNPFVMSQCHADLRGLGGSPVLVESAFAWRRATGERETCWCKRGVSLVSGMIGGIGGIV